MRGTVSERAWGLTLGSLGARQYTGQLLLQADGRQYGLAFDRGDVIGATSPAPADAVARIALTNHLVTSSQVPDLMRRLTANPGRDDVDVVAEVVKLSADQVRDLRAKAVAQRAARTFSVDEGEYMLSDEIAMPITPNTRIPVGAVIHLGVRMNLSEQRLAADLRELGSQFTLVDDAAPDLSRFGIALDVPILEALRAGTSLPALEAVHRDVDPRTMQAIIYTLVACGAARSTQLPAIGRPTSEREWATASGTAGPAREWKIAHGTPGQSVDLDIGRAPTHAQRSAIGTASDHDPDFSRAPTRPSEVAALAAAERQQDPAAVSRAYTKAGSGVPERTAAPPAAPPRTPTRTAPESFRTPAPPGSRPPPVSTWIPVSELRAPAEPSSPPASDARTPSTTRTPPSELRSPARPLEPGEPPSAPRTATGDRPFQGVSQPRNPFSSGRAVTPGQVDDRIVPRVTTPPSNSTSVPRTSTPVTPRAASPRTGAPSSPPSRAASPPTEGRSPTPGSSRTTTAPRTNPTSSPPRTTTPTAVRRTSTPPSAPRTPTPQVARTTSASKPPLSRIGIHSGPETAIVDVPQETALPRTTSSDWSESKLDATPNSQAAAADAFARGERALKRDDIDEAVEALKQAVELSPKDLDYQATYAWAQFCAARDRERIAPETRKVLERASHKSDNPEIARFYLGRVERMLGRDKEALRHFQEVLTLKPNHRDAQSEIRVIEARLPRRR